MGNAVFMLSQLTKWKLPVQRCILCAVCVALKHPCSAIVTGYTGVVWSFNGIMWSPALCATGMCVCLGDALWSLLSSWASSFTVWKDAPPVFNKQSMCCLFMGLKEVVVGKLHPVLIRTWWKACFLMFVLKISLALAKNLGPDAADWGIFLDRFWLVKWFFLLSRLTLRVKLGSQKDLLMQWREQYYVFCNFLAAMFAMETSHKAASVSHTDYSQLF